MSPLAALEKLISDGSEAYAGTTDRPEFLINAAKFFMNDASRLLAHVKQLKADKKRMEECLGWYADRNNYIERKTFRGDDLSGVLDWICPIRDEDQGQRARECLHGVGKLEDAR